MAIKIFDEMEQLNNGMSAEWFIDRIVDKETWKRESELYSN